jgi:hypothetical protein
MREPASHEGPALFVRRRTGAGDLEIVVFIDSAHPRDSHQG